LLRLNMKSVCPSVVQAGRPSSLLPHFTR
jgi:hypothetical protein